MNAAAVECTAGHISSATHSNSYHTVCASVRHVVVKFRER